MDYIECPCKKVKCDRYGNCDECKKYHHNKNFRKSCKINRSSDKKSFIHESCSGRRDESEYAVRSSATHL